MIALLKNFGSTPWVRRMTPWILLAGAALYLVGAAIGKANRVPIGEAAIVATFFAVFTVAVIYVYSLLAWLTLRLPLGFQRLGFVLYPAFFVTAFAYHVAVNSQWWPKWPEKLIVDIASTTVITAIGAAAYLCFVRLGVWITEGFR